MAEINIVDSNTWRIPLTTRMVALATLTLMDWYMAEYTVSMTPEARARMKPSLSLMYRRGCSISKDTNEVAVEMRDLKKLSS